MNSDLFVEDSFFLSPKDVLRNASRIQKKAVDEGRKRVDLEYWLEDIGDQSIVLVNVGGKESQRIALEWEGITFGERAYFLCACGHRATKLYLPRSSTQFKCRKCHGLQYQLSSFNRYSTAGRFLYRANRLQKLANNRAGMARIFYNGNYTKRFERFLGLCDKAGLDDVVQGAKALKELVRG